MAMRTAITIGGGPAGLAAATHLAREGFDVTLLESRSGLGGRAASDPWEGVTLNQGPHALYWGGVGRPELERLGVGLPQAWNPTPPLGTALLTGPDALKRVPVGPRGGLQLTRWLAGVARGRSLDPALSAQRWLDVALPDPAARGVGAALVRVTSFCADHAALSARAAAAQLRLGLAPGVRYLGPWQRLVDDLAAAARAAGAQVRTRAAVKALEQGPDGGWTVRTDADELRSDVVVLAAGTPAVARKLLGDTPGAERLPQAPREAQVASLDLVLDRLPRRFRRFALGTTEPHYLAIHSPRSADHVLVSVAAYLTPEDRTSGTRGRLEQVAELMLPGWRAHLRTARHLPRLTALGLVPAPGADGLAVRPGEDAAGLEGLRLAGDWVGSEGLLVDAALRSARRAAEQLAAVPAAVAA